MVKCRQGKNCNQECYHKEPHELSKSCVVCVDVDLMDSNKGLPCVKNITEVK